MADILDGPLGGPVAVTAGICHREGFHLSYNDGKAVQEILNRYVGELRVHRGELDRALLADEDRDWAKKQDSKDIDYITKLAKLFD